MPQPVLKFEIGLAPSERTSCILVVVALATYLVGGVAHLFTNALGYIGVGVSLGIFLTAGIVLAIPPLVRKIRDRRLPAVIDFKYTYERTRRFWTLLLRTFSVQLLVTIVIVTFAVAVDQLSPGARPFLYLFPPVALAIFWLAWRSRGRILDWAVTEQCRYESALHLRDYTVIGHLPAWLEKKY